MFKMIFSGIGLLILVIAISVALAFGYWFFIRETAEIAGISEAERQIESAPNRIANYEHFFDLCASIQERSAALEIQEELLDSAETNSEKARIRANVAGIGASRRGLIAQYNADANKVYTRARFLGDSLPRKIDPSEENITCER